jgi:hypothetical protein
MADNAGRGESMRLIEEYSEYNVYEHGSGKAVLIIKNTKRGNNGAIFGNVAEAQAKALALMWGGSISLTHRFKMPEVTA